MTPTNGAGSAGAQSAGRGETHRPHRAAAWGWTGLAVAALMALGGCAPLELMDPQGAIGEQEKTLILVALGLMLLVVVPVIILTLVFAWRYRESNTAATYAPRWSHSNAIEVVVWSIPCLIVLTLGVLIWRTTHTLDPHRPLVSDTPPVRVEVVALNWKWLFIYPDYGVATVNHLELPVGTPVDFRLTADSLMNSFFIPQLGTQVYAMSGMQTRLHLIAGHTGTFAGLSAAFSGPGFSDMHFDAKVDSRQDFDAWVAQAKEQPLVLDEAAFSALKQPSAKVAPRTYAGVAPGLFDTIANQYMPPADNCVVPAGKAGAQSAEARE